jgi:hypothetical protein
LPLIYGWVLAEFWSGFRKEPNLSEDVGIDYRMETRYEVR